MQQHNNTDGSRQCLHCGTVHTGRLSLRRLLHLREQATRSGNTTAVAVLDMLIARARHQA